MQSARAAIALLALAAIEAPAQDASHAFVVDVEVSQRSSDSYVAQFRVRDATGQRLVAERAIAYTGKGDARVDVGTTPARRCTSGSARGYCLELVVGSGADAQRTQAFISGDGEMKLVSASIP
jgi:hypothetical protein